MTTAVRLHLLDGVRLVVRERDVRVPESGMRTLVFLALRRVAVSRKEAAGELWPDVGEPRAAGNLRSALWRLRGAEAGLVDAGPDDLRLAPHVQVDVDQFDRWAKRLIGGTFHPGDLDAGRSYQGALDLLPGWYENWAIAERERLRHRLLHALDQLSGVLSARGRHAAAVDAAITAVCADPLRESAQRALVAAHLAEGNLAEARRTERLYRDLLRRELGIGWTIDRPVPAHACPGPGSVRNLGRGTPAGSRAADGG